MTKITDFIEDNIVWLLTLITIVPYILIILL